MSQSHTTPATEVAGVVWDFGGVLVDWDPRPAIVAGVGETEADRFLTEFDFHAWNVACDGGRSWPDALAVLEREAPQFLAAGRAYVEHFADALVGEIPGTADLIRDLHAAGVRQFGLTNWAHQTYHDHAPARFDVIGLLEDVVVSGTEGLLKPDPAIYRRLEQRIGVPLDRLAFVDDKPENVEAARRLGMHGLVFTGADTVRAQLRSLGITV